MRTFTYAAEFGPGDRRGVIVVSFPDVPEAITQGDDLADARIQAEEALGLRCCPIRSAGCRCRSRAPRERV